MKKIITFAFIVLVLAGCLPTKPGPQAGPAQAVESHLKNIVRLTSDGDNGEAYFSWDGKKLIWQSSRADTPATRSGP